MNRFVFTVRMKAIGFAAFSLFGCVSETVSVPSMDNGPEAQNASRADSLMSSDGDDLEDGDRGENRFHVPTTMTPGAVGHIEIGDFFIGAVFPLGSSNILRARSHPECVVHLFQPVTCCFAPAGTLTVTSDDVGTAGGPAAPFVLNPDVPFGGQYDEFPDPPLFNYPDGSKVQFELTGNSEFPAIASTTLRSPPFGPVNITAPLVPDSFEVVVSSSAPLKIAWDVPSTHFHAAARHPQSMFIRLLVLGPVQWAQLFCSWPISAGHGRVPVILLRELRAQVGGGTEALGASIELQAGEFKEIATPASSYATFVSTDNSTSVTIPDAGTMLFAFIATLD